MEVELKDYRIFRYMFILGLAIVFLAILMVLSGSNAEAADIYVDDDNTAGPWDGSMANPYQNITSAITNSIPFDTIYVWNGTYNENITVDKELTIIGNSSADTTIDSSGVGNNIVNITAEGVQISGFNITNNEIYYGIWTNVGGFSIHDNIFYSQNLVNWAIYMDVSRLNSGSTTVGDIIVDNNEVIGTHGFYFNIWIEEPLSGSDLIFGDTVISHNKLYNTQTGIQIDRYTVFSMDQGTITWGDILVKDNYVNSSGSEGIFFWGIFWNMTDVNIDLGAMEFSDNNITAQYNGIYIDWWDFADGFYGNTIATTQDTQVYDNDIVSQSSHGLMMQTDIIGNIIYDSTSITTGDFYIYSNNITSESSAPGHAGIYFQMSEIAQEMYNDSSVNFGNIYIDSNFIDANSRGIYFNIVNSFGSEAYDNALVNIGDVSITNNEILSTNEGVYISFNNLGSVMYDQASAISGNFIINNNNLSSGGNGINIDMDQLGFDLHDSASFAMGDFTMISNNITSVGQGINIMGKNIARIMHNDTIFSMGDFMVNNNVINSTSSMGINFGISSSAYTMIRNATATFGNFLFTNNNITALNSHGLWFGWYDVGYEMYDGAVVSIKDFHLNDNTLECGPNSRGIYSEFNDIGYNMHGDSIFSLGNWYAEGNIILSGQWGIYAGPQYWGYDMYGNSHFIYGDFFIRNNMINVTGGRGITIDYIDTGENMAGTSSVTGGNMSITNNIVSSRDNYGFYIYYDFIGYNISDFSYVSTGWIDISYNNFSSVNNHGAYIWIYYLGAYTYGNSQVYIGDIMFTHNNVRSDTMDALHFYQFYQNAYQMYNDSYVQIGNVLVNDNYLNASGTGDGIELFQWQEIAYEMSHNASADFGNFEIQRNWIDANESGIYIWELAYLGYEIYDNSTAVFGDFLFDGNTINASDYGIYINAYYLGSNMGDNSTFWMGNWTINNNDIQSGGSGLYFYPESFGRENGEFSNVTIGSNEIMGNTINSTGEYGIYSGWWYYFAHTLSGSVSIEIGGGYLMNNDVWMGNVSGIAIDCHIYQTGYEVGGDSQIILGDYVVSNNDVYSAYNGIWIHYEWVGMFAGVTGSPSSMTVVDIGDLLINNNVINAPNYMGLTLDYHLVGAYPVLNSAVTVGMIQIYNNTIESYEDAMDIELAWLGDSMQDDSWASIGICEIDNNNLNSTNKTGIYVRVFRCSFAMRENSEFYWEGIYITNNDITAQGVGIDFWLDDCVELTDSSIVDFPGIWIIGNTVNSSLSAFNFTTITTPIELAPTATFTWGDVVIEDNIFHGDLFGIVLDWRDPNATIGQPSFNIKNCDIIGGISGSTGLYLFNIDNVYNEQVDIDTFDYGIYSNNSHVHYYLNGSIENCVVLDISLYSASYLFMINSTFDNSSVFFEDFDSLLEVAWFMNVLVQSQVALPVPEALVAVADVDATEIFNGTANADGQAFYIICMEYQENITGIIKNFNDYTANATKGVDFGVAVPNPTMNQTRLVIITLTDLTPPTIFGDNSDTAGTTGDPFYFEINASDNMGIVSVHVNYRPEGVGMYKNLTMNGTGPYWLDENMPSDHVGLIEYYFTAVDSGGFWVNTTPTTAPITDNDTPTYVWISQPLAGTTGESVLVSIQATDNIDITYYKIDIDGILYDLVKDGDYYNFNLDIPPDSITDIIYSIILNDSANNPITILGTTITVTDNDEPTYTWVLNPTTGLAGGSFKVSLMATDNIGITNYTITINGTTYDMVKEGDYYNYTYNIPPGSTEDITYNVTFMDNVGNLNTTADTVLTITDVDTEAPNYNWILQPTAGTTGESVLVSLLATDNLEIVYYKIEIDGVLYDLIKDGDYYNYTINIPSDSLASITYSVTFNDAADNPATTPDTTITVTDNDAPAYTWILHPYTGTAGGSVLVSLTASDNIGITYYKIEVDGTLYDLIKDGYYFNYTINLPPGSSDSITYDITFKDAADNEISTSDTVITVTIPIDSEPPEFTWVLHPDTGTTGDSLLISVMATDNIGITYYKISVDGTLYNLVKEGDYYNYTINIPANSLASIIYFVVFNDSANNPNTATLTVITVTDNDPTTISNPASDTSGEKGKDFRFQIDASDNIGISEVKVWYWFGDDDSQKKSLILTEENGTYSGSIIPEESGNLHYYFEATDTQGNAFQSDEYSVAIGTAEKEDEEEMNVFPFIILVIIIIIVLLLFLLTRKKKESEEIPEVEEGLAEGEEEVEEIEAEEGEGEESEEGTEEEYEEEEIVGEEPEEEAEAEEMEPSEELDLEEETEGREL